jgi:hypothetical protein
MPRQLGPAFALATTGGRPVRCYIRREVLDDRVSYQRMTYVFDYFSEHADVFYRVAQRKFDAGEFAEDGRIIIDNDDVYGEPLPDIRGGWRADNRDAVPRCWFRKRSGSGRKQPDQNGDGLRNHFKNINGLAQNPIGYRYTIPKYFITDSIT